MNDLGRKVRLFKLRELRDDTIELGAKFGIAAASSCSLYYNFGTWGLVAGGALTVLFAKAASDTDIAKLIHDSDSIIDVPANHPAISMLKDHVEKLDGMNMPRLCFNSSDDPEEEDMPYAGAAGTRESSIVIISKGIEKHFTPAELDAVLAHEVEHIWEEDTKSNAQAQALAMGAKFSWTFNLLQSITAVLPVVSGPTLKEFTTAYALFLGTKILESQMSQSFERRADRGAVETCHNPWALSSALGKLQELVNINFIKKDMSPPNSSVTGRIMSRVFGSHPLTRSRKARMQALAEELYKNHPEERVELDDIRYRTLKEIQAFESKHKPASTDGYINVSELLDKIFKFKGIKSLFGDMASPRSIHERQITEDPEIVASPAFQTPTDDRLLMDATPSMKESPVTSIGAIQHARTSDQSSNVKELGL